MIFLLYAARQQQPHPTRTSQRKPAAPATPLARQAHGPSGGRPRICLDTRSNRAYTQSMHRPERKSAKARPDRMPRMPGAFAASVRRATAGGVRRGSAGWRWSVSVPPASVRRSLHEAAAACPWASPVGQGHGRFPTRRQGPGPVRCGRRARGARPFRQRERVPPRERRPSKANQGESSCVGM